MKRRVRVACQWTIGRWPIIMLSSSKVQYHIFGLLTTHRYEEAKAKGVDNYERELEDAIDRLIVECDRKIGRALKRLEDEDAKAAIAISVSEVTQVRPNKFMHFHQFYLILFFSFIWMLKILTLQTPEMLELSKQIKEKLKEADQHGNVYLSSHMNYSRHCCFEPFNFLQIEDNLASIRTFLYYDQELID